MNDKGQSWSAAEAKSRFGELVDRALANGPQTVTRNGRRTVVIVAADEWDRRSKPRENIVDFLNRSPLRGSGLVIERPKGPPRGSES